MSTRDPLDNIYIPCLSLRDPWCWCVTDLNKGIENRKWSTNFRGTFAIHLSVGGKYDENLAILKQVRDLGFDPQFYTGRHRRPMGSVVAVAELVDVIAKNAPDGAGRITQLSQDPRWWFREQYGFVLGRVRKIDPMPCRGMLNFFRTPPDIHRKLVETVLAWGSWPLATKVRLAAP